MAKKKTAKKIAAPAPVDPPDTVRPAYQGLHSWRYEREPLEKAFALAWQRDNELAGGASARDDHQALSMLLSPTARPGRHLSERDKKVAATVIQWLGSAVGQSFVENVLKTTR